MRAEMKNIVRFWFDMSVDGMRVDAIWGISKDPDLKDDSPNPDFYGNPNNYGAFIHDQCKMGPHFQEYLRELASVCDEYNDKQMVFEFYPDDKLGDVYHQYSQILTVHPKASAFFMEYRDNEWHAKNIEKKINNYLQSASSTMPFFCIGNHDQPRIASRLGEERARALSFLNLLTPGISVVYYGDEIGMMNGELTADDIQDNFSPANSIVDSRDLERTPMQWNDSQFAGFSSVKPWLPVNDNHTKINVDNEKIANNSLLNMHRKLLKLRQTLPILKNGDLSIVENTGNGFILGLKRELVGQRAYIFINFADEKQSFFIPENAKIIDSTHSVNLITVENLQMTIPGYCGVLLIA